jgi:hypothetical protein
MTEEKGGGPAVVDGGGGARAGVKNPNRPIGLALICQKHYAQERKIYEYVVVKQSRAATEENRARHV